MSILETKKKSVPWKEGKVISVRLRDGIYVLAQMVKSPYMVFFNLFSEDNSGEGVRKKGRSKSIFVGKSKGNDERLAQLKKQLKKHKVKVREIK